ncbi:MAG: hypothetical protein IKZ10_05440 [Akkermansia sp.]|nr:hypothetical protein [Akkermansia sp.]
MEKEYTDDPGLISGSPDNPTEVPASFHMKSLLEIYGTHGGAEKVLKSSSIEPGDRATDKQERIKQATNFTKEKGKVLLQKWFSKCKCHKLINRVR